jgi:hypothetical protein
MAPTTLHYPGEVVQQVELSLEWLDMRALTYHERGSTVRSKGVHVSGIIKHIAHLRRLYKDDDQLDEMPTVVLLGSAFEESAVRLYDDMVWQPGEIERDGVFGSPDGRSVMADQLAILFKIMTCWVLAEFKFTYKSRRHRQDIRAEQTWMMQVMDYLWMDADTYRASDGNYYVWLHVLWACDNYVMPFRPKYMKYLVRFTEQELVRNWAMMLKYKQFAIREG